MTSAQLEIQLIAAVAAIACAIPGTFLVLRKMAMISDAISHSILPGIVLGFFITHNLNSPLLIILAAATGIFTVVLVEFIQKTGLVKEDTAIGLVFPVLFSIGVILIGLNANDVHLDTDAVLLGELAFAPFDRILIGQTDFGPKSLWVIGAILLVSLILLLLYFKELKISTFDKSLAATLGFSPVIMHYGLMSVASVTAVGAFDAVGAILVVALMTGPPAMAWLLTKDLKKMLLLACCFGFFSAILGYWIANWAGASIPGAMTTVMALLFLFIYLFAPQKGLLSVYYRRKRQRLEAHLLILLLHLSNHTETSERQIKHLSEHINWHKVKAQTVVKLALENNLIEVDSHKILDLTDKGRKFTEKVLYFITTNKQSGIEEINKEYLLFRG